MWAWVAADASEAVATRLLATIKVKISQLLDFPFAAPAREQFAPGLRVTFHGAYAIYFKPGDQELVVVRVLHGARDAAALADKGGFGAP